MLRAVTHASSFVIVCTLSTTISVYTQVIVRVLRHCGGHKKQVASLTWSLILVQTSTPCEHLVLKRILVIRTQVNSQRRIVLGEVARSGMLRYDIFSCAVLVGQTLAFMQQKICGKYTPDHLNKRSECDECRRALTLRSHYQREGGSSTVVSCYHVYLHAML